MEKTKKSNNSMAAKTHNKKRCFVIRTDKTRVGEINRMTGNKMDLLNQYQSRVAETAREVEGLRSYWNRMKLNPNSDIDYYLTVISTLKNVIRPFVLTFVEQEEIKSIVVGRVEYRKLNFVVGYKKVLEIPIKSLTVIYGGLFGDVSGKNGDLLISELLGFLRKKEVDAVYFNNLALDSPLFEKILKGPGFLLRQHFVKPIAHWRIVLSGKYHEFFSSLDYRVRKNLRRAVKKIAAAGSNGSKIQRFTSPQEVRTFMTLAEEISKKTYQRGLGVGFKGDEANERLIRLAAERGWLRAYVFFWDEIPIAFDKGLKYGNTFFWEVGGYDPAYRDIEPGTNLFLKIMEDLCSDPDIKYIDFGFGDAGYKRHYCSQKIEEASFYMFAPTAKGVFLSFLWNLFNRGLILAENASFYKGYAMRMKRFWRDRLSQRHEN